MVKIHDRDYFYKYTTSETAIAVLRNKQIHLRSPIYFNDPFDSRITLGFDRVTQDFDKICESEFRRLVLGDDNIKVSSAHLATQIIASLRRNRSSVSPVWLHEQIEELKTKFLGTMDAIEASFINDAEHKVESVVAFCVSETNDNLLMWSHYSDGHKGVVLRFKCMPEQDTILCAAMPVKYQSKYPTICTDEEYLKHYTGQNELPLDELYERMVFTKNVNWSYEKEWRCVGPRLNIDTEFQENQIFKEEIDEIYLGCRISNEDKEQLLNIIENDFAHVVVYEAKAKSHEFGLEFKKMK